jgi:hypothetical protein
MMSSDSSNRVSLDVDSLTFDSFGRTSQDVVCMVPVRTIVRREEEIILIRRVRKVEEIDASPACPVNTTQLSDVVLETNGSAGF